VGRKFVAEAKLPEEFIADRGVARNTIDPYFFGVEESFKQAVDCRMEYLS
jgi:hypothetical protein